MIDRGLILLRELNAHGFDVVARFDPNRLPIPPVKYEDR